MNFPNFLTPGLAAAAAAIAIPALLILYFLKLRRRDVEISTTLLWKKAIQDMQANAPFQKLRRNILLFLQLLILAAVLMALGQPYMEGQAAIATRHIILIDRSASMSAMDATDSRGRTVSRLDAAKEQALAVIDSLREPGPFRANAAGDQAMVITFDTSAQALQTFTHDKALLRAAVRAIEPSDAPSSIDEAFRLVQAQAPRRTRIEIVEETGEQRTWELPPDPVGTIHLFSDGRLPDLDKMRPGPDDRVIYHAQGQPDTANVGITSLRAGRAFDDPNQLSIFVGLQSTFTERRNVEVELRIDNAVAAIRTVALPAATREVPRETDEETTAAEAPRMTPALGGTVFTLNRPQGGLVTLNIGPSDALETDNRAFLVVPPAQRLAVGVVTRGNLFLASALESLPLAKLEVLTPEQYERMRRRSPGQYDVVILDGYLPEPAAPQGDDPPLPPGRYLIFNDVPAGPMGLIDHGRQEAASMFINWMRDHPVLRGISLDPIYIGRSRRVEVPPDSAARVLATTDDGPGIIELTAADSRAIIVPFDIAESYWPFDISFVVFMAQAVQYLGEDDSVLGQSIQPGGVLSDRLPPGARDVRVRLPRGDEAVVGETSPDGRIVYGPIQRAGIYQLSWIGSAGPSDAQVGSRIVRPFAANLLDSYSSDIAALETLPLVSGDVAAQRDSRADATRRLWPWLLLAALGVMLVEWWVYNRRVQL